MSTGKKLSQRRPSTRNSGCTDDMSEYNLACSSTSSPEHNIHTVVVIGTPTPAQENHVAKEGRPDLPIHQNIAATASFTLEEDEVVNRLRIFESPNEDDDGPDEEVDGQQDKMNEEQSNFTTP